MGLSEAASFLDEPVAVYLRHLRLERGLSANTLAAYRRDLVKYQGFLHARGITSLDRVTSAAVSDFAVSLSKPAAGGESGQTAGSSAVSKPMAARSAARIIVAVRGFHRFLLAEGLMAEDPAARVRPSDPPARLPKALTVTQVEAMLDVPNTETPLGLRDRALLEFLYGTGARISEAVGLAVDDLLSLDSGSRDSGIEDSGSASERGRVSLVRLTGKGSKQRMVPIGSYALKALDEYRVRAWPELAGRATSRNQATGALFLNARGGRLSRQSAWTILQTTAERAGITQDVSPHTLRHSFATHLVEGGADIRAVQELMGHASISSTQIYTRVTADTLREVYATSHPRAR